MSNTEQCSLCHDNTCLFLCMVWMSVRAAKSTSERSQIAQSFIQSDYYHCKKKIELTPLLRRIRDVQDRGQSRAILRLKSQLMKAGIAISVIGEQKEIHLGEKKLYQSRDVKEVIEKYKYLNGEDFVYSAIEVVQDVKSLVGLYKELSVNFVRALYKANVLTREFNAILNSSIRLVQVHLRSTLPITLQEELNKIYFRIGNIDPDSELAAHFNFLIELMVSLHLLSQINEY